IFIIPLSILLLGNSLVNRLLPKRFSRSRETDAERLANIAKAEEINLRAIRGGIQTGNF
ncbi:MAG: hypothetical protein IH840_10695, partial [Candidatus Heimdallarchaeota archaeon]|nr:hypothetical protein [Candidatus Heimdallarchaeota archaeon]